MDPTPGGRSFPEGSERTPSHRIKPIIRTKGTVIQRGNEADFTKRRARERWERYERRVPALTRAISLFRSPLHLFVELLVSRGEDVMVAGHPHIQSREQENAHDQIGD